MTGKKKSNGIRIFAIKDKELCRECKWNYSCIDDCSDCDMYLTDEKVCYCLNTKDGEYCERSEKRRLRSGKIKKGEKNEF